MHFCEDI